MTIKSPLTNLVELTSNLTDAYTTALFVIDPEAEALKLRHHLTLSPHLNADAIIPMGTGPIGQVASDLCPVLLDFAENEAPNLEYYSQKEELKGLMVVPVQRKGTALGVLVIDTKEHYKFSTKLQKIVAGLAAQVAWHLSIESEHPNWIESEPPDFSQTLKWCRFLGESQDRKTLCERFMHIPRSLIHCDATAVVWFKSDGTGRVLRSKGWEQTLNELKIEPGRGLCGTVAETGSPLLIRNTSYHDYFVFAENEHDEPMGSIAAAPIISQKRIQGIVVCGARRPQGLNRTDLDKLNMMTSFASFALMWWDIKSQWEYDKNLCQVTGIPNHRFLATHLETIEREVFRDGAPASILTAEIQNLNPVYESMGVEPGDRLLEQVVAQLSKVIETPKFIFRYSETALVILLANMKEHEANQLEARLQALFKDHTFSLGSRTLQVEINFGHASFPMDGLRLSDLIGTSWSRASLPKSRIND